MSTDTIRRAPLGTLASVIVGRSYPDEVRTDDPHDVIELFGDREFRMTDWRPQRVRRSQLGPRDVTVSDGELVVGLVVPVGPPTIIDGGDRLLDARHAALRPGKGSPVTREWLFVWASSSEFREQIIARARTMRSRISVQELRTFTVPLPSRELQIQAFEEIRTLEVATQLAQRQSTLLDELRLAMADRSVAVSMLGDGSQ